MSKKPHWTETKKYGNLYDGQFIMYCNHTCGWEQAKANIKNDLSGLGFEYKHYDNKGGATYVTLEEAKEIHEKIGQYIEYMEELDE